MRTALPRCRVFFRPVMIPFSIASITPSRDHLGVDAEIPLPLQLGRDRVGDAADAELEGRAIRDQLGDVIGDPLLDLGARLAAQFGEVDRRPPPLASPGRRG